MDWNKIDSIMRKGISDALRGPANTGNEKFAKLILEKAAENTLTALKEYHKQTNPETSED